MVTKEPVETVKKTLKVVYFSEDQFKREYGNSLAKIRPDIQIQVIPSGEIVGGKLITYDTTRILEQKPDIIYGLNLLSDLKKMGKLVELSPLVKQDQFDLNAFSGAAIEQIRAVGDGMLFGLSPTFQSAALFYNKAIFDQLKIPYPTNQMSWPSVLELAKKFARVEEGKQQYGIDINRPPYLLVSQYLGQTGVSSRDAEGKTVNYVSDAYRTGVNVVAEAYRTGAIYLPPENPPAVSSSKEGYLRNKFIAGEAALAYSNPGLIEALKKAAAAGIPAFPWDIVTEPVNPSNPNTAYSTVATDVFAIVSDTPDKMAAWQFIKTITGPEMADELAKSKPYVLSTRKDHVLAVDGRKMDAFYALGGIDTSAIGKNQWSPQLSQQMSTLSSEEITGIIYGRKTVTEGLASLQKRAEQALADEFAAAKK
ncbi:extracellular solute-binding protein [Paenibacillus mesophilus]|uniref:extracellular solute-binding protein n=1 Tax=Paenibacillus mesophilus TaxID=2582849 RepID=UPI00130509A8|nr:extracellular solute-binding protein [Paenibacillus mesophilus]